MAKTERCGLKGCEKALGPGAADVGYTMHGKVENIRVCAMHAWTLMTAQPGTYRITEGRTLEAIPAKQHFT